MKQLKIILTSILILLMAMFCNFFPPAFADSDIDKMAEQFDSYFHNPLDRAKEIKTELNRIRQIETGFANQYNVRSSEIITYELYLEQAVNNYLKIYYTNQSMDTLDSQMLDIADLNNYISKKEPFSYSFYISVIHYYNQCLNDITFIQERLDALAREKEHLILVKDIAESEYRVNWEKSISDGEYRLKYKFLTLMAKAKLESCASQMEQIDVTSKYYTNSLSNYKDNIDKITPMVKKVRAELDLSSVEYGELDSYMNEYTESIEKTVEILKEKHTALINMQKQYADLTDITKFYVASEKQHITDELFVIFDLLEILTCVRNTWHQLENLLTDNYNPSEKQTINNSLQEYTKACSRVTDMAKKQIQILRTQKEQMDDLVFSGFNAYNKGELKKTYDFYQNIDTRINRYFQYIAITNEIIGYIGTFSAETNRSINEASANEKINKILVGNFVNILDNEVWHVDKYPITIKKLMIALLITLIGLFATRLSMSFVRKHYNKKNMNNNGIMLILYIIFSFGMVLTFLITLWILHIPLTAFAYAGGAIAIAIGFGTQKVVGDITAGFLILFRGKIRIGDEIIINNIDGDVVEITLQNTIIKTYDLKHVIIPNSKMLESTVINVTLESSVIRSEIDIKITNDCDIDAAKAIIEEAVSNNKCVLQTPKFYVLTSAFEDSYVTFKIRFYADISKNIEPYAQSSVRSDVIDVLRANGIKTQTNKTEVKIVDN